MALSCLRPDVARTYQEAAQSQATYVVVHGTLDFDAAKMPENDLSDPTDRSATLPATIRGQGLTRRGFTSPFATGITLRAECMAHWCPTLTPGTEVVGFFEKTDEGYALTVTPCGGMVFTEPSDADLGRIEACFQGKRCDSP